MAVVTTPVAVTTNLRLSLSGNLADIVAFYQQLLNALTANGLNTTGLQNASVTTAFDIAGITPASFNSFLTQLANLKTASAGTTVNITADFSQKA